ncbi:MAG: trimethylamine methyltransferase, partial [Rhodobacteraceae bacterium]
MTEAPTRRGGRRRGAEDLSPVRQPAYRNLRNPFPRMRLFPDDAVQAMHHDALDVLERLGVMVLLPEARRLFADAGALVDEDGQIVRIGRDIVDAALASAPKSFRLACANPDRDILFEPGAMIFMAGAGAPHATDLVRGRRPGTERDFREFIRLVQHFDVLPILGPTVEPQDVALPFRHYAFMDAQLTLADKFPFAYARGTRQVEECFELLCAFQGL